MQTYLAVLGRLPALSLAELERQFSHVRQLSSTLATFDSATPPALSRLGGSLKLAEKLDSSPLDYLKSLPEGKITLGISDFSRGASRRTATLEALKLKKILSRLSRSVRVLENRDAVLSTATSHHNQLSEKRNHVELIKFNHDWYRVLAVQNITAYAHRDRVRPARDARVGMLPPKLAQILINLCGPLSARKILLDPFCGTGVVLQEALLSGFSVLGSDLEPRMVEYTKKNLDWLKAQPLLTFPPDCDIIDICVGDATVFDWQNVAPYLSAVACETYLGSPLSAPPSELKLQSEKQTCRTIILGFLENLAPQLAKDTPVVLAVPAWLRPSGRYSRLNLLDDIANLGYNVVKLETSTGPLLYYREGQIVAREIIILRKS